MTNDALDPGPDGSFPHWPRRADGSPDPERMPSGLVRVRLRSGRVVLIDQTQVDPETGLPFDPPTLPPGGSGV